jgi:hypothetical protein
LLKEDVRFLMGDGLIGGLLARMVLLVGCWVILEIRENMGQCKSEHWDFKKAKERTQYSASLQTETLRVTLMQFLDVAAVVCLQVWALRL